MGKDEALLHLRAVNTLTRLGVAAGRLGIDALSLTRRTTELVASIDRYVRVWMDADVQRLGLRTLATPVLARPGTAYVELESIPKSAESLETALVLGTNPLADDLAVLADGGVERGVVDEMGTKLQMLGVSTSELLGRRAVPGDERWLIGIAVGGASVGEVSRLADALRTSQFQLAMLGQLHTELAPGGCLVSVACTTRSITELTVEYRAVAWERVIRLTDMLLSIKSARGYGVFAGAFNADSAGCVEITFRPEQKPRVRVGLEDRLE